MGFCFDCGKTNENQAYEQVRQEAKQTAIQTNEAQAIYKEGGQYNYTSAAAATAGGIPVLEFISPIP